MPLARCSTTSAPARLLLLTSLVLFTSACRDAEDGAVPEHLPDEVPAAELPAAPALGELAKLTVQGAPSDAARLLRLNPTAGTVTRVRLVLAQTVRHHGPGLPQSESTITQSLQVEETVLSATPDAIETEAVVTSVDATFVPDITDAVEASRRALLGLRYRVRTDRRNAVLAVTPVGSLDGPQRAAFDALAASLRQSSFVLPEPAVAPGATWTATSEVAVPVTGGATLPSRATTEYRLKGYGLHDGASVALVEVTVRQSSKGTMRVADSSVEAVGAAAGHGLLLFDAEKGRLVGSELALGARQQLLVQGIDTRQLLVQDQTLRAELRIAAEADAASR